MCTINTISGLSKRKWKFDGVSLFKKLKWCFPQNGPNFHKVSEICSVLKMSQTLIRFLNFFSVC